MICGDIHSNVVHRGVVDVVDAVGLFVVAAAFAATHRCLCVVCRC